MFFFRLELELVHLTAELRVVVHCERGEVGSGQYVDAQRVEYFLVGHEPLAQALAFVRWYDGQLEHLVYLVLLPALFTLDDRVEQQLAALLGAQYVVARSHTLKELSVHVVFAAVRRYVRRLHIDRVTASSLARSRL